MGEDDESRGLSAAGRMLLVLGLAAVAVASLSATAVADHRNSPTQANLTVVADSPADRQPGSSNASWLVLSSEFSIPSGGYQYLDYTMAMSGVHNTHALSWANCHPTDVPAYGIDRGNDESGTTTDDGLLSKTEGTGNKKHRVWGQFFEPEDFGGGTVHLNESDQIVVKWKDCMQVTDEPGWYQASGLLNGTTYDGEFVGSVNQSHYIWICDCQSEQEATEKLGPKPSSDTQETPTGTATPTSTPTATATPTPTPATGGGGQGDGSGSNDRPVDPTATPTPTPTADGQGGATAAGGQPQAQQGTATRTGMVPVTPTIAEGPGFGAGLSLLALVGAALIALRRG